MLIKGGPDLRSKEQILMCNGDYKWSSKSLTRRFGDLCSNFLQFDFDLFKIIEKYVKQQTEVTLLDAGCGAGITIESILRSQKHLFGENSAHIKGIGIDNNLITPMLKLKNLSFPDIETHNANFLKNLPKNHKYCKFMQNYRTKTREKLKKAKQKDLNNKEFDAFMEPFYTEWEPLVKKYMAFLQESRNNIYTTCLAEYKTADVTQMPIKSQEIDILLSHAVAMYVPDGLKMLEECWRVLKIGGFAVISNPDGITNFAQNINVLKEIEEQGILNAVTWQETPEKTKQQYKTSFPEWKNNYPNAGLLYMQKTTDKPLKFDKKLKQTIKTRKNPTQTCQELFISGIYK